jgi:FeS assembly SUF system protein
MSLPQQIGTSRLHPDDASHAEPNGVAVAQAPEPPAAPPAPLAEPLTFEQIKELNERIVAALCTCFDPEVPVNIYELGLIYSIEIAPTGSVGIKMTLTSPGCPVAGTLPPEVERKVQAVGNVTSAKVDVVWDPPWDKSRMSEAAKLQLGIDDW